MTDFRNLTVRASLALCGIMVVAANLIVLLAYFYSGTIESGIQDEIARVTEVRRTADAIRSGMLEARRLEKEFLLARTPELMDRHTQVMGSTFDLSARFLEMVKDDETLVAVGNELDEAMVTYADDFQKVFDLQTEMGYTAELGLQGQMRGAIRDVEARLAEARQPRLELAVLQLRRNEKDFMLRLDRKYVDAFDKLAGEFATTIETAGLDGEQQKALVSGLALYRARFGDLVAKQFELLDVSSAMDEHADGLEPILERMSGAADALESRIRDHAASGRALARSIVIGVLVVTGGILVVAFLLITRRVAPPLAGAARFCAEIADGDLRREIEPGRRDEIGDLLRSLSAMSGRLREVVGDVRERTLSISTSSSEIAQGNAELSRRTEQQAASLEETASSMEQMTSTVRQNSDNARQANQLATAAREQAEKGGEVMSGAVRAMSEISTASRRIAEIIGVVDEIAFQTNLLALNAAVEAARAGEQGRGFAVVASEVRNLAQRSATAAREIKDLISDSVQKVSAGSKLVDQSGATLAGIVTGVKKVSDIVSEIAAASIEQAEGIEQVNRAVTQMDEMTQQNAALVEQAAASARSLEEQAAAMSRAVAFFTLSDQHVPPARSAVEARGTGSGTAQVREAAAVAVPRRAADPAHGGAGAPRSSKGAADDAEWEEF